MPATPQQIRAQPTTALDAVDKVSVRSVLAQESAVAVPTDAEITTALTALDAGDGSGRQALRAELALYTSSQAEIDGGTDALTLSPVIQRWGVRNAVRLLLGFSAEPRPATAGSLQLASLPLTRYGTCDEWSC